MSDDVSTVLVWGAVTVAATVATVLSLAQSDAVSRRWGSPLSLAAKRLASYHYRWNQALLQQTQQFYQYEQAVSTRSSPLDSLLTTAQEMDALMGHILSKTSSLQRFRVVRIGRDERRSDTENSNSSGASSQATSYFVWLAYETAERTSHHLVQLPLIPFGLALARALDEQYISTVTLCFASDAAGGQASDCLSGLFGALDGVECLHHPAWLVQWTLLHQEVQDSVPTGSSGSTELLSTSHLERCLYAFCRLATIVCPLDSNTHTILVTIPPAMVPRLLPIVHTRFPHDRHVFAYRGCVASVAHASRSRVTLPTWQSFPSANVTTTPTQSTMVPRLGGSTYADALSRVSVTVAAPTECWMAAVDAVLVRKRDVPDYVPYMCQLDYVLRHVSTTAWHESSSYWSTRSLIQYVTGSASRPVPPDVMETARTWLQTRDSAQWVSSHASLATATRRGIENIVFCHKLIVIANKTLPDTVAPAQHWTLKQAAKRGGCACCMVDDDDDDEATQVMETSTNGVRQRRGKEDSLQGIVSAAASRTYVDGTSVYAFDPTQFT